MTEAPSPEQIVAAFCMLIGPSSASSFFVALSGFYIHNFQSSAFFIATCFCLYVPYPCMGVLQEQLDAYFDRAYSTRTTYYFRVVVAQIVLAGLTLAWMFLPQSPYVILALAAAIGSTVGAVNSSALQMLANVNTSLTIYGRLGMVCGGVLPALVLLLFGFEPSSSLHKLRLVLATIPVACVLCTVYLSVLHSGTGAFDKAYRRLSYDLDVEDLSEGQFARQVTETQPLNPDVAKLGVPSWVWQWVSCTGCLACLQACMVGLVGVFGSAALAQLLSVLSLFASFVGKVAALPISHVPCFKEGPWHKSFGTLMMCFAGLTAVIFARMWGAVVPAFAFFVAWSLAMGIAEWLTSLAAVTTTSYVKVSDRKFVVRRMFLVETTSGALGLALALLVLLQLRGVNHLDFPSGNHVITK